MSKNTACTKISAPAMSKNTACTKISAPAKVVATLAGLGVSRPVTTLAELAQLLGDYGMLGQTATR